MDDGDNVSLAASASEWSDSASEPSASIQTAPSERSSLDNELVRLLSRAVEDLEIDWSPPEEAARSRLDEWYLQGRRPPPAQRFAPFFPEVHEEIAKAWKAPFSSRPKSAFSPALSTVDGAQERGYLHLPSLEEPIAAHLCPPSTTG
ncbi:MAG: hypothetical protein ACRDC4_09795, partial [Plesiomonas sp.]